MASTAGVYAFIRTKEYEEAEKLAAGFILNPTECTEENELMFTAASKLYEAMGRKKEKQQTDRAIKEYGERLEAELADFDMDDEDEYSFGDWDDDDLPF